MTHKYERVGLKLGYPKCCINHFIENCESESWTEYMESNPYYGTGFICCPRCIDKQVELAIHIIVNRDPSLPKFPDFDPYTGGQL